MLVCGCDSDRLLHALRVGLMHIQATDRQDVSVTARMLPHAPKSFKPPACRFSKVSGKLASTGRTPSTLNAGHHTLLVNNPARQNTQSAHALSYDDLLGRNETVMDAAKSMAHPIAKMLVMETRDRLTAAIKAENVCSWSPRSSYT